MERKDSALLVEGATDKSQQEMNYLAFIACLAELIASGDNHKGIDKGRTEE